MRFVPQTVCVFNLRRRRGRRRGQAEGFARKTTTYKNGDDSGMVYGIVFSQEHIGLPAASVHSLKRSAPSCVGRGLLRKSF